jgi:cytochrome o ubiquinol oxidase operon protein cyoD
MKAIHQYILGFTLSLVSTGAAFALVQMHLDSYHHFPSHEVAVPALVVLALIQFVTQLVLFLHVGQEEKPKLNFWSFVFAVLVVVIIVGGTLWIMNNLSHGMRDTQPNIFEEENIFPEGHGHH